MRNNVKRIIDIGFLLITSPFIASSVSVLMICGRIFD
jgi:hypothetical protein